MSSSETDQSRLALELDREDKMRERLERHARPSTGAESRRTSMAD